MGYETRLDHSKPLIEHLRELRFRLSVCIVAIAAMSVVGFWKSNLIIGWLRKPLDMTLYFSAPAGGLTFIIKIALFSGFLLSLPIVMYQFVKFIAPVLPQKKTRNKLISFVLASLLLTAIGVGFGYFVSLPIALGFLTSIVTEGVEPLISADEYFNFTVAYLIAFALIFQLPLIFLFINKIKPLNPKKLLFGQKWVIVASLFLAAILTPTPDFINQAVMAAPIILLYQISVLMVWIGQFTRKKELPLASSPHEFTAVLPKSIKVQLHPTPGAYINVQQPILDSLKNMPKLDPLFTIRR